VSRNIRIMTGEGKGEERLSRGDVRNSLFL
jgi:hypothetical protein